MKLTVASLFSSVEKKLSRKRYRSQSCSISRSDTGASSSSSSSSSSDSLNRDPTPRSALASSPKITRSELEAVLRRLGQDPPSDEEISLILDEADAACAPEVDDLQNAFKVFDADGDGRISAQELLNVFLSLGDQACTLDECHKMIGSVDSDGDGLVCFRDFTRMMAGQSS